MPDLRLMAPETHTSFNEIVLEGTRAPLGMASFADVLTEADAERVHQYIISVAIEDRLEAEAEAAESTSG